MPSSAMCGARFGATTMLLLVPKLVFVALCFNTKIVSAADTRTHRHADRHKSTHAHIVSDSRTQASSLRTPTFHTMSGLKAEQHISSSYKIRVLS